MIIKFDEIETSVLPAFKGGEKEFEAKMFFDGTNRIMKGCLAEGASIGFHRHEGTCEVIFIIMGEGTLTEEDSVTGAQVQKRVTAGDCLYCPENHSHSLMNTSKGGDLVFYAAVTRQ